MDAILATLMHAMLAACNNDLMVRKRSKSSVKNAELAGRRSLLKREVYESVCARWNELGFEGEPPKITNFENFEGQVHI